MEADFWVSTRESEEAFGGAPEGSGLGGSQPSEVGEDCSVPGRSQVLEGSMREHQEGSLACTVGPPFEGSPAVSEELGEVTVASIPTVLVSGSTTPSEGVQKSRHRVERGLQTPVEDLESQGSALRAEPPRNDPGETVSGLGETQTLPDGQRSGDLRQPDSCVALGDGVSLVGGESAPQEVLACQAKIQPQGGDSGLDTQVQRLNSDLVGGRCASQEILLCQAIVQPQGVDSGLDSQVQRLNSDLVGGRCAPQKVLVHQEVVQPQGVDSGLDNRVQRLNSDLVGGRCASQKVLVCQAVAQPQGGDPGLENQVQRLNSDLVEGQCALQEVLACQVIVQLQGGDSELDGQVRRLNSDLAWGRCAPQKVLVCQAIGQPQGGDPGLENPVQRLNSDPVGGRYAPKDVLACQAIVQPQGGDSGLNGQVQRLNSDLVGGRCASQKVLVRQAVIQSEGTDPGLEDQVQGVPPDLEGGATDNSAPTMLSSEEATPSWRVLDPRREGRGREVSPRALVQPEGTDPRLEGQLQVNSPALVEEWYRATSISTLTMLDSGGTAPGGRVQSPRGEDQVQAVIPDLLEGRVVKGCPAPGATAPHSPQPQWWESFERPGAWLSSLAAVSNHCGLLSGWTELSLGRGQVSHPGGRVGNTTVLVMVVLSCSWDTSVSKVRLGAAQMGSASKEKGSPWVGLVGPEGMDRGIQLESGRRRTGACPCCCGPGSLFCRLKQGSTSG
ncbi:hypothetical protein NDU88_005247 [Pleurodeles waltl]|uniref:Uncharacterized protein n=1 Tax=Pleurodeles waltl TaxID=8319 RepID=A0AAV7MXS8_PLEWA|nr:hypothetical protein NDU88_005247 [Pleurodeles waltl]